MNRPDDEPRDSFEVLRLDDDIEAGVRANRDRFDQAAQAGRRRRHRKLASLAAGTTVVLFVGGAATMLTGGEPDRLAITDEVVAPTAAIESLAVDTNAAPATVEAPSNGPTLPLPLPATTTPPSPPSSSVEPVPTTLTPATQPAAEGPSIGSPSDVYVTVSRDRSAVIDVRNTVDVVASYDLTCPSDRDCLVQAVRVMGDTIWIALTEAQPGTADPVERARVMSVTRSTGDIVEHLSLEGGLTVRSAGLGADGVLYANLADNGPNRSLVAIESGQVRVLDTNVSGFRLSDDGRFLAVSFSDPPRGETARFEISDLIDQSSIGFETPHVNAGPGAWSPDGRALIVNEQWEDGTAWVIDPWSGSGDPIFGDPKVWENRILDGACFMNDRTVAHRTWDVGYGQGDAQPGVIRLTSLDTGSTVAEFGDDIFGDALRCHPDGSISYLRRPVVEVELSPDFTQLEADLDAPTELVHITADGTISIRTVGDLRMV